MKKGIYIVSTPIGNIKDISERAREVLENADIIACEDTRVTKKLLDLLNIPGSGKKLLTFHDHNEDKKASEIIELAETEEHIIAQVSDAGSPLISDPGYRLAHLCREKNIDFSVVPGCCAIICALQMSGLPTNRFMFAGFIPNRDKARLDLFTELKDIKTTLVFYETAPRLLKTLEAAQKIFPSRQMAVAREMTKIYEECKNATAEELIAYFSQNPPKGEIVFMVAPPEDTKENNIDIKSVLRQKMLSMPLKGAVKQAVEEYGLNKNEVYRLALELKNEQL